MYMLHCINSCTGLLLCHPMYIRGVRIQSTQAVDANGYIHRNQLYTQELNSHGNHKMMPSVHTG